MRGSSSIKTRLLTYMLKAARFRLAKPLVTILFRNMDKILPADRLCENEFWMAFHHPKPEYPLHILILPKQGLPALIDAAYCPPEFYAALFSMVRTLILEKDLEKRGYRLISNGGPNQSIPQWHWHLISDFHSE
ncbi:MAG: HIT domain-containing protein [Chloroflexota bacterium]|nr:HIT domain-containing protein [Chloroflexota bacterium]